MQTKFIKVTNKNSKDKELINPVFITRITNNGLGTFVYTMDGKAVCVEETADVILKKLKIVNSEKYLLQQT